MRKIRFITVILIALISFWDSLYAQPKDRLVADQLIAWSSCSAFLKFTPRTTLFLDGHFRFASADETNAAFEPMQVLLRTHLQFNLKGKLTFAPFGYAYIHNYQYGKQPTAVVNHERRIYQEVAYSHSWGKATIGHRLRTEERFIEEHSSAAEPLPIGFTNRQFRIRYRFLATRPIGKEKLEPGTFFAQTFYEGFISRGKKVTFDDVDQNRLFFGLGYQPIKGLNLSAGCFYQMLVKTNGAKQENNFGLMLMATHNIDLTNNLTEK